MRRLAAGPGAGVAAPAEMRFKTVGVSERPPASVFSTRIAVVDEAFKTTDPTRRSLLGVLAVTALVREVEAVAKDPDLDISSVIRRYAGSSGGGMRPEAALLGRVR